MSNGDPSSVAHEFQPIRLDHSAISSLHAPNCELDSQKLIVHPQRNRSKCRIDRQLDPGLVSEQVKFPVRFLTAFSDIR